MTDAVVGPQFAPDVSEETRAFSDGRRAGAEAVVAKSGDLARALGVRILERERGMFLEAAADLRDTLPFATDAMPDGLILALESELNEAFPQSEEHMHGYQAGNLGDLSDILIKKVALAVQAKYEPGFLSGWARKHGVRPISDQNHFLAQLMAEVAGEYDLSEEYELTIGEEAKLMAVIRIVYEVTCQFYDKHPPDSAPTQPDAHVNDNQAHNMTGATV